MHRVNNLMGQLEGNKSRSASSLREFKTSASASKSDDDVVIVSALRTAIGRGRRGSFAKLTVDEMLAPMLKETISRTKVDPSLIGDVVVGSVLGQNSQRAMECRIAALMAGIPESVPVHLVNRQCSSGLQAVAHVAASIKAGFYDVGLACGVESMSSGFQSAGWEGAVNPKIFLDQQAKGCLLPMGITSENVAARYGITRKQQDELAVRSHARAAQAIKEGRFKEEIVPLTVEIKDPKTGKKTKKVVDTDEGCRAGTTMEILGKLKPAFKKTGSTTAGNSSQVSDGAAVVLVASRKKARELGLPIVGRFVSFAVTGVPADVMGIGPAVAIPAALKQAGLSKDDIDVYEINEAFASQATYCVNKLGLDWAKVNPNGGAIAIGHPLGMTGARMTATLLSELKRQKARYGVVSMCIGSGMGAAAVYERE